MADGLEDDVNTDFSLPPHLAADRSIHVIVSVLSGTQQAQSYFETTLEPFLAKHGVTYTRHVTESTGSVTKFTKEIFLPQSRKGVHQTVILLSGDGGVIDIINGLGNELLTDRGQISSDKTYVKPIICLFPQGTANALAWSSRIASDPLQVMVQGRPKPIPMFQATFSETAKLVVNEDTVLRDFTETPNNGNPQICGAVVFSWGLHASLVAKSDTKEYRKHGLERFRMAAGELMKENHAYRGKISIKRLGSSEWEPLSKREASSTTSAEHQDQQQELAYLAMTLVSNLEEHYCISPHHEPLSDLMHVVYMPHLPQSEIGELTFLPYQHGKHIEDPRVVYEAIEELRIDIEEEDDIWTQICVDGQIIQLSRGGWAQVRRLAGVSVADVVAPEV